MVERDRRRHRHSGRARPHVLHHVGLLADTALVAGTGDTVLFGALGLLASIPPLLRPRRRFHSWWAPLIGLAVFAAMFSLSAFVIDQPSAAPTTLRRPRRLPRHQRTAKPVAGPQWTSHLSPEFG